MNQTETSPTRFALISVSDKTGITQLALALKQNGFTLLSTGGTANKLKSAGIEVRGVSEHTGFDEMFQQVLNNRIWRPERHRSG